MLAFHVAAGNKYFSSDKTGCLFNKNGATLLHHPKGKSKTEPTFVVPKTVNVIGESAFAFDRVKEIKIDNINNNISNNPSNISNNKLYDYNNNMNNINKNDININSTAYRKNYSIKNGELNLDIKSLNLNNIKKEEDDGQKYSSEKRNFRLKELNLNRNYANNVDENNNNYLGKNNNYNYDMNEIKDERMNYASATDGFI